MNRRTFLKSTTASALSLAAFPAILRADAPSASNQFTTAVIGAGWWGTNILNEALAAGRSKIVAVCDPDPNQIDKCVADAALGNAPPKKYKDYRELLEKEKPQIVINATPDHWHARITVDALRAGAHVYVEKPISHTILEGLAMVKTARAADRVVQVGTHRRISPHNISAREFIRSGKAGKIGMVRSFVNYGGNGPEKPAPNTAPPAGMDWDLWCGPAPLRPFNPKIHTRGHRHFLDYANGQLGDWGIHWLDQILWIMDQTHPRTVFSAGGRAVRGPAVNDATGQTSDAPDHQAATFDFDSFTATWEHRQFAGNNQDKGENVGCYFFGTEGTLHLGWQSGWTFYPTDGRKAPTNVPAQLHTRDSNNIKELWADFLDSIDRKRRPVCDIEDGHRSTTCALLGMISMKLGRSVHWDPATHTIPNDPEANALLKRDYRPGWTYPTA
jgi:predicted dehydrogenase